MNLEPLRKQGNLINNTIYMGRGKMIAAYGSSAFLEECRQMNEKEVKAGTSKKYEYVMLPFLGEKKTKNWTLTLPAGYVGLNSALKKDIISTQKGQEALMKDLRLDNSYLKQFDRSDSKAPSGLEPTLFRTSTALVQASFLPQFWWSIIGSISWVPIVRVGFRAVIGS